MSMTSSVLKIFVVSFALVISANAQTAGCVVLQSGQEFCPTLAQATVSPVSSTAAPAAEPLADRMKSVATEIKDVEKAKDGLRSAVGHTDTQAATSASFADSGNMNMVGLVVLVVLLLGVVGFLLSRRQNHPVHPPQPPQPAQSAPLPQHIPVTFNAQPLNIGFAGGNIQLGVVTQPQPAPPASAPVPPAPPAPLVPAPAPALPAAGSAPVGTPCPQCATPKPTAVAAFCSACGHVLPALLIALLFFGTIERVNGQTSNDVWLRAKVNGVEGWLHQVAAPATHTKAAVTSSPAPAPVRRSAVAVRRVAAPVDSELRRLTAVVNRLAEQRLSSVPTSPTSLAATPNASPSGVAGADFQKLVDRLGKNEAEIRQVAGTVNAHTDRLGDIQNRLGGVEQRQAADHNTLGYVGAAAITGSKHDRCEAYKSLLDQGIVRAESSKPPKGCRMEK